MFSSFDVLLRSTLVQLPRYVPTQVLSWTDPEGPYPLIFHLQSRGSYKIPLYIFIKNDISHDEAASLPVVLDFHGGGFVLGSCLEQAPFCSKVARELGAVVISVDYRLGPTYKFPAALEDAEDVLQAILEPESKSGLALREAIKLKVQENWRLSGKSLKKVVRKQEKKERKEKRVEEKKERKEEKKERKEEKRANKLASKNASKNPTPLPSKKASPEASKQITPTPSIKGSPRSSVELLPAVIDLDPSRVAISGFSSGGNIALNLGISLQQDNTEDPWPSVFPSTYKHNIPLLLFYPSLDSRQLPSERTLPKELPPSSGFWAETSDILAPTYLPRNMAGHPRASPGLAPIEDIHDAARMLLVLPGLDSLADQSEIWVKKVKASGRGPHLRLERYPAMKHGWTQMPDGWLNPNELNQKKDIYEQSIDFTRKLWAQDETALKDRTSLEGI